MNFELPFFQWKFPNLLFLELVVEIVVGIGETAAGKVAVVVVDTVVVVGFDTGWVLAYEHFLASPSRKNLGDFSI